MKKLTIYISILFTMEVNAQITSDGIESIKLNENISSYPRAVKFPDYKDSNLFWANPENQYYNLPANEIFLDSLKVKYVFLFADSSRCVKKITIILDDSDSTGITTLEKWLGTEHTTAWTSMGYVAGNVSYGWVTPLKTVIIFSKTGSTNKFLGFPPSQINIFKQEDYSLINGSSIRAEI